MNTFQKPKVSVITLNYNQIDYTLDCVSSILKSDYPNFDIILVDNGSSDENFKILQNRLPKDTRINIQRLKINKGYVGGINSGLKKANNTDCEYFLIMNNDTFIDKNAITEFIDSSKSHNDNAIITGKVYHYYKPDILQNVGQFCRDSKKLDYPPIITSYHEEDKGQYNTEEERGMIDDIFWLIPKKIFDEIGYYSDFFYLYGEQNDYALKAVKKGYKLLYTPKAKIWHIGGLTTADADKTNSPRVVYWTTFGTLKLSELHLSLKEAKNFRRIWVFKNIIKKINLFLKGKITFRIIISFILATHHFRHWRIIKYKDNGYNPY